MILSALLSRLMPKPPEWTAVLHDGTRLAYPTRERAYRSAALNAMYIGRGHVSQQGRTFAVTKPQ